MKIYLSLLFLAMITSGSILASESDEDLVPLLEGKTSRSTQPKIDLRGNEGFGDGFNQYCEWCRQNSASVNIQKMKDLLRPLVLKDSHKAFKNHCRIGFQVPDDVMIEKMYETMKQEEKEKVATTSEKPVPASKAPAVPVAVKSAPTGKATNTDALNAAGITLDFDKPKVGLRHRSKQQPEASLVTAAS